MSKLYRKSTVSVERIYGVIYATSILSNYTHSKNAFKTVLARSGAEKNSFFCFWPFLSDLWTIFDGRTLWFSGSGLSKYSKKSENFRKGTPVNKGRWYKNVPKYSCFGYWFSRYIFTKKLGIPKLLPKRMALTHTLSPQIRLRHAKKEFRVIRNVWRAKTVQYCSEYAKLPKYVLLARKVRGIY